MSKRCTSAWVAVRRGREALRSTSGGGLTGLERVGRREGGETGGARLRAWALGEPRDNAVYIDGRGDRDVLHVGFRHAPIPRPTQAKGAHALRERPFDPGPLLRQLLPLLAGRPRLRRLQRLVLVLGREPQPPASVLGTGTGGPYGTRLTCVLVEFHNDRATALPTPMLPPRHREVALGAAHLLLVPGHLKPLEGVSPLDLRLPSLAGARGASQDDALVVTTLDEEFRADRGRIDQVLLGRHVLVDQ